MQVKGLPTIAAKARIPRQDKTFRGKLLTLLTNQQVRHVSEEDH
jgi:hypothetical protein